MSKLMDYLYELGVALVLMRCAGLPASVSSTDVLFPGHNYFSVFFPLFSPL